MATVTLDPAGFPTLKYSGYALRDVGPAGGWVFYDKGSYSDGWRYLEAAPVGLEMTLKWMIGLYTFATAITAQAIGVGARNTAAIAVIVTSSTTVMESLAQAAHFCLNLRYGGFSDWFLPSKDELNLMYTNLKVSGVGGFADNYYWSSSEYDDNNAWLQDFTNGSQGPYNKSNNLRVRAVRAF